MLAFGRGFFVRCARPKGCAPFEPRQGVPPAPHALEALRRPCRGPRRGAGVPGKSAPDTLPAGLGRSGRVKGPCPRPYGAAGRTNPLTRPSLEKRARGPRRGLEGHCRSGWGSRLAQRPRSGLALTPRNDPNAPGWWLGCSSPSRLPRGERPRRPPEALLPLIFASEVWGFGGGTPPETRSQRNRPSEAQGGPFVYPGFRSEHDKRSLRKCALASLRGLERRHPVGASRGFTR